jgi:Domain of unknown function (DUF4263)
VRLVFVPMLVDNPDDPAARIKGKFIYQKKGRSVSWEGVSITPLGTIKKGEAYQLDLHSSELLTLVKALSPLYRMVWAGGVPQGKSTFVRVEAGLTRFLELNEPEFRAFLEAHAEEAATTLNRLLQWLSLSPKLPDILKQLAGLPAAEIPPLSALLGLSTLKAALSDWKDNASRADEAFWQEAFTCRSFVLSQLFSYPVILLKEKAYLGGKAFDNTGGNVSDFLLKAVATGALLIIELKTPSTILLGPEYRSGVFPLSAELSGAVSQVLHYRQNLQKNFFALKSESVDAVTLGEPRIVVLAGHTQQLDTQAKLESFELLRHRLAGVTIVTFDELFERLATSIALIENAS